MRREILLLGAALTSACVDLSTKPLPDNPSDPATETFAPATGVDISKMTKTATGVYYLDTQVGAGDSLTTLRLVELNFVGRLANGMIFDETTAARVFDLNAIVRGLSEGMLGMRLGGSRKVVVPSARAYGASGLPSFGIPGNATLVYDVTIYSFP